jgi:geranylgeranyl diphosphate synthase type II
MHSFTDLVSSFEQRFTQSLPFSQSPVGLYGPCRYLLHLGGKRVRPVLCLMAAELFGDITEDAWHGAFGIELFHNFTLIHDDIMDQAPLRRGQPAIHARYGLTAGILCGDVMCIYAYEQLGAIGKPLQQILQVFGRTAIEVCEGQQMDMDFEQRNDVTMDEYLHMITLKTSVLLACSLKMGALTGGALGDNAGKLYQFGKNMGIAFQLQDDYLDAFGDTAKLGKQNGGDIKANKKTCLLLSAQQRANDAQRRQLNELMAHSGPDKVTDMLRLYVQTGADKACRDDVAVPTKRKGPLKELAEYLLMREG